MPISAERMKLYPGGSIKSPEWLAIRASIQARARNRCEGCDVENYSIGGRDEDGNWYDSTDDDAKPGEYAFCSGARGERELRLIKIVCTVAHVDCDETNNNHSNLKFWCQRCHNRHDSQHRQKNAARTRRAKSDQIDLEDLL